MYLSLLVSTAIGKGHVDAMLVSKLFMLDYSSALCLSLFTIPDVNSAF
jgi:hypothetical protein